MNLTQEQLKIVVNSLQAKRDQGLNETNDSEYKKLLEILQRHSQQNGSSSSPQLNNAVQSGVAELNLTAEQLKQLKYQIIAFKLISRNLPVPLELQQLLAQPIHRAQSQGTIAASIAEASHMQISLSDGAFVSPYSLLKQKITPYAHASRQQKLIIPSITPQVDIYALRKKREESIQKRIDDRLHDLENSVVSDDSQKLRALIELKSLRLLDKQRSLKRNVLNSLNQSTALLNAYDRNSFKRIKKNFVREAKTTEKIEKHQRQQREQKVKQKRLDYLSSIFNHGRDLVNHSRVKQNKFVRISRAVTQYHQSVEREEQKRIERMKKERLLALKADDEEAYLKLVNEAKDTRLTHLLQQTDGYLENLSSAVRKQQNESKSALGVVESDDVEIADGDDDYSVAHRVREKVTKQSSLLVGGSLKDYQIKGLEWMVSLYNNHLNGILADEMGLGKTIQTISLVSFLIEKKKQLGPYLIIVPLSTLTNWVLEFEKWAPSVVKVVYKGSPQARKAVQMNEMRTGSFNVLLTTYEYIIKDRPVLSKYKWIFTIIDEGHRMKNANSRLSVTLCQNYSTRYRLILTGTPLQNNLPELWALLNFILPKVFNSVKSFEEWFNTPFANQGGQERIDLNEEEQLLIIRRLHKILRPFILRRLKKDVESELPDKVEIVIKCKLSSLQLRLYEQMRRYGVLFTGSTDTKGKNNVRGLSNMVMQLRKICNHPFVFDEVEDVVNPARLTNDLLYRVCGKFELLDRVLPKLHVTGHRVLVFFQMTAVITIMEDYLLYRGYKYLRLDGGTKSEDRSALLKQFNAPDSPFFLFLLSTRAGGLGLNLQTADTVIIFDSDWNPHADLQAQDRAHRIGQTKEVRILRLVTSNSIEENILARAQFKLDMDGKVIQAGKFDQKSTAEEREAFLRTLIEGTKEDDEEDAEKEEMEDDELNDLIARDEQELATFQRMDKERYESEEQEWRARGGKGPTPTRLISLEELPDIYKSEYTPEEEVIGIRGRGARERTQVKYDDGLTEEQWLDSIDNENVDDQLPQNDDVKREMQDASNSLEPPSKRRKSESSESSFTDEPVEEKAAELFQRVMNLQDENGAYRCSLFLELPSRDDYPDYFEAIKNPISLQEIQSESYSSFEDCINDYFLMVSNAKQYNEEGSSVWTDAEIIWEEVKVWADELGLKISVQGKGLRINAK